MYVCMIYVKVSMLMFSAFFLIRCKNDIAINMVLTVCGTKK